MEIDATQKTSHNLSTARRRRHLSMSPQRAHRLDKTDIGCQHDRQWITMMTGFPYCRSET